jgi:hypothetical protein
MNGERDTKADLISCEETDNKCFKSLGRYTSQNLLEQKSSFATANVYNNIVSTGRKRPHSSIPFHKHDPDSIRVEQQQN